MPENALADPYAGKTAEQIADMLRSQGFTQEGVNALYAARGIPNPPTVPASFLGGRQGSGRDTRLYGSNGSLLGSSDRGAARDFLNQLNNTAIDPYRVRSGISNIAGGLLNLVGSAVGGPVWGAMTALADAGNNALGNNDGTSYTDGQRSTADQVGALAGSIYSGTDAPGSYASNNSLPGGVIDESGATGGSSGGGSMGWDWGRILDYAGPIIGGYLEGQGAKDAADTSAAGSTAAIAEQRRQYDQTRADQLPWLQAGTNALGQLQDPQANFTASPDYAFRREEGTRDIGNSFAARGGALSGNALRSLTEFNSGLAGGEYGNWWNRQAGLAGVGQTAATNLGSVGANSASNIGNALQSGANARASGVAGQTNALTGTLADILSTWNRNRNTNTSYPSWGS